MSQHLDHLRARDPKLGITFNEDESAVSVLRGRLSEPVPLAQLRKTPYQYAREFVRSNKTLLGEIDETKQLGEERVTTDRRDVTHVIFSQKHGEAEVLDGGLSVHFAPDGTVQLLKSDLAFGIDAPEKAKITAEQAAEIAVKHAGRGASFFSAIKPVLVVAGPRTLHPRNGDHKYHLCWKLGVSVPQGGPEGDSFYLVDAITGDVVLRYSAIQTGLGTGYYSHGATVVSEASGTTHRLRDTTTCAPWVINTYDDAGSTSETLTNYSVDDDDNWSHAGPPRVDDQRPEVDIQRFAGYVFDFYLDNFGFNSWSFGADIKLHAHNEYYHNNAFWSGLYHQVYFADGDGTTYDFMCPLDVVGHELTHGVNHHFNIVQIYQNESGALNEAIADTMGAFISLGHPTDKPDPWKHGSQYDLVHHQGRNLADPARDSSLVVQYDTTSNATKLASYPFCPDHYSIRYDPPQPWNQLNDNGGVHVNAPIIGHALYLMAMGGTNRVSNVAVTAIGVAPVEQMLFEVMSAGLLTNTSTFADFRLAFITACQTLYPDNLDYLATVKTAFYAVGIGADLYVRDTLADVGVEPALTLSCMSPDIILRQQPADAATLAAIGDINNGSLGQPIELGPADHSVYFRVFNRGSVGASGTFRLFISPVSTFPSPASWTEVGHFDLPVIAAGGFWVPQDAGDCIPLTSALINTLGLGHFCFIGIVESQSDPPPDHTLINNVGEFHDFIQKSNNYAWRNTDIFDNVHPDAHGVIPAAFHDFYMFGFGKRPTRRLLEVDTRDLPEGTAVVVWLPQAKVPGVRLLEAAPGLAHQATKVGGALVAPKLRDPDFPPGPEPKPHLGGLQIGAFAEAAALNPFVRQAINAPEFREAFPVHLVPGKLLRLSGLNLAGDERLNVRFAVKLPDNLVTRDVALAFREYDATGMLGQINFVFRVRAAAFRRKLVEERRAVFAKAV